MHWAVTYSLKASYYLAPQSFGKKLGMNAWLLLDSQYNVHSEISIQITVDHTSYVAKGLSNERRSVMCDDLKVGRGVKALGEWIGTKPL